MSDGSLCRALYEIYETTGVQAATALCRRADLRFHGSKSASQAFGSMSFILQVSNLSRRRSNSFLIATPRKARSAAFLQTAPAQKLVDLDKVAPEFVATKRRAEQIRMMDCNKKAEEAKALPRDRAAHVQHCLNGQQGPRYGCLRL